MKPLSQRALFRLGVLLFLAAGVGEGTAATVTAPWGQHFEYSLDGGRMETLTTVGVATVLPDPESAPLDPDSVAAADVTTHVRGFVGGQRLSGVGRLGV